MTSNSQENEENSDNEREETLLHRTKGHLQKEVSTEKQSPIDRK